MPRGQHSLSTNDARCSLFNSERDIPERHGDIIEAELEEPAAPEEISEA